MRAAQFLHIGINFKSGTKVDELVPAFNKALDWLRYSPNCWVVWTTSSPEQWYARLKPHLSEEDQMFIAALDLNKGYYGWLTKDMWDWFTKDREKA